VILVDTSVWVDHLRRGVPALAAALELGDVLTHPFVVGELACGGLHNRRGVLELLSALPAAPKATDSEVLGFIEQRSLMGKGIGYVDAHLLAATVLHGGASIWTRDKRLAVVAQASRLAFVE
jgi:hypothetical protein